MDLYYSCDIMSKTPEKSDRELSSESVTEYKKTEDERMNRLKSEYRDYVYNLMFSDKITIHEWWKKRRVSTYMSKWKIWIKWMEAKYDDLYIPFRGYSIGIARSWDKSWLISMRDGSIIREIEYDKIIVDNKDKLLVLVQWDDVEEIYCYNFKESRHW